MREFATGTLIGRPAAPDRAGAVPGLPGLARVRLHDRADVHGGRWAGPCLTRCHRRGDDRRVRRDRPDGSRDGAQRARAPGSRSSSGTAQPSAARRWSTRARELALGACGAGRRRCRRDDGVGRRGGARGARRERAAGRAAPRLGGAGDEHDRPDRPSRSSPPRPRGTACTCSTLPSRAASPWPRRRSSSRWSVASARPTSAPRRCSTR